MGFIDHFKEGIKQNKNASCSDQPPKFTGGKNEYFFQWKGLVKEGEQQVGIVGSERTIRNNES